MPYYPAWIACGDNVGRYILRHHGAGPYGHIVAYGDAREDYRASFDPDIVPDGHRFRPFLAAAPLDGVGAVACRIYAHIGVDETVVANGHLGLVQDGEAEIGEEMPSHAYLLPIVAVERLVDDDLVISYMPQQLLENGELSLRIQRRQGVIPVYNLLRLPKLLEQLHIPGRIHHSSHHLFFLCHVNDIYTCKVNYFSRLFLFYDKNVW